ncbi:MAG: hypothetical protein LBG48_03355 [Rickettsiales bacterium]|jgi:hypothetical protein|nr:hypothetical protein [Rickettsiales bacterium]
MFFRKEVMKNRYLLFLIIFVGLGLGATDAGEIKLENYQPERNTTTVERRRSYYFPYIDGYFLGEYTLNFLDNEQKEFFDDDARTAGYFDLKTSFDINFSRSFALVNTYRLRPIMSRKYQGTYYNNDYYAKEGYFKKKMYFSEYDFLMEEIYLKFFTSELQFGFGKFNSNYGLAHSYDKYSGIFGNYFTKEYAIDEVLGGFIKINLPFFVFSLNSFYRDTTFLSRTVFGERQHLRSDTLSGTSEKFNNFSVSGEFIINDLKVNLSFRRLAVVNNDQKAEKGYLIGIERMFEYFNGIDFVPFFEYNYADNFEGRSERKIHYFTANAPFIYENWNFLVGISTKYDSDRYFSQKKVSYLAQANIGYGFENGVLLDIGRAVGKEYRNMIHSPTKKLKGSLDSWNVRLSYMIDFREAK